MYEVTQQRVKELFDYQPDTGLLVRKSNFKGIRKPGNVVGSTNGRGYLRVNVDGQSMYIHRVIWLWAHGELPKGEMDHINHNPSDNRIKNLRVCETNHINKRNRPLLKSNTSGVNGVNWHKTFNKWMAKIKVDGKAIFLGYFKDLDDAAFARAEADRRYGFHENHGDKNKTPSDQKSNEE